MIKGIVWIVISPEQANIVKTFIRTSNSGLVLNLSLLAEKDFNFAVTDNVC